MRYWLTNGDGQSHGPYTIEELQRWQAEGRIANAAMLCAEGGTSWEPATGLLGQAPQVVVPPMRPEAVPAVGNWSSVSSYASFGSRFAALIIDSVILFVGSLLVGVVIGVVLGAGGTDKQAIEAIANLVGLVLGWLYYAVQESSAAQATLGKRLMGIRVTDLEGAPISFGRATGRYFAKLLSGCILLIGYIMAAFTPRKQALHDMIASTLVVSGRA